MKFEDLDCPNGQKCSSFQHDQVRIYPYPGERILTLTRYPAASLDTVTTPYQRLNGARWRTALVTICQHYGLGVC